MAVLHEIQIQMIGWRVFIEDTEAFAEAIWPMAYQITQLSGELVRDSAQTDKPFTNRTWDTVNSMDDDPIMYSGGDEIHAEIGASTPYSNLLELGWMKNGNFYIFPFLIPAIMKHEVDFINAHIDMMGFLLGERVNLKPPYANNGALQAMVNVTRSGLYKYSKALGDVAVIFGTRFISPVRSAMMTAAKELGDVNAIMNHTIATRISTRITGAVTGRGLGYVNTVSVSKSYSAYPGGGGNAGVGSRVYNRVAGRATAPIARSGFIK